MPLCTFRGRAGGAIETSADGESWTSQTSGTANMLNFVIYDSHTSKYWAVGENGTMLSSADGITWATVSLPAGVATHNPHRNGVGTTLVFSWCPTLPDGNGQLYSTDGAGATWTRRSLWCVAVGWRHVLICRNTNGTHRDYHVFIQRAGNMGWETQIEGGGDMFSIATPPPPASSRGQNGFVATCPTASAPSAANWTVRSSGTSATLRAFAANGAVYLVGSAGVVRESLDEGETWAEGLRLACPRYCASAPPILLTLPVLLVVGDSGVLLFGQYPFKMACYVSEEARANKGPVLGSVEEAYVDTPKRVVVPGLLEIDVGSVFP